MSNIGDMLVDVKGLKSVHDNIKSTFSTKQELTNVDNKFSEVNSARQSGNGTTYNNLKARLDADKEAVEADIGELKADLGALSGLDTDDKTSMVGAVNSVNSKTSLADDALAGKNLLTIPEETVTVNGIEYTMDGEKVIANGTATAHSSLYFQFKAPFSGEYILSGSYPNGSALTWYINIRDMPGTADIGSGIRVTLTSGVVYSAHILIANGVTVSNIVFKPSVVYADSGKGIINDKFGKISESSRNLIDLSAFRRDAVEIRNGVVSATASKFYSNFRDGIDLGVDFEENTQYTLTFFAKNRTGAEESNGLRFDIEYTDDTKSSRLLSNSITSYEKIIIRSSKEKTVKKIKIVYASHGEFVWDLKNIGLFKGLTITDYVPNISAVDGVARMSYKTAKISFLGWSAYLGNAIPIIFNDGTVFMIDSFIVGAWSNVESELSRLGITHIDYFMLTHWHEDHCGNIVNLISNGYIDHTTTIYLPQALDTSATGNLPSDWSAVVQNESTISTAIENAGITPIRPSEGDKVDICGCEIEFWNTDHSVFYPSGTYPSRNYNDWSLCAYLTCGNLVLCFTGDIGPIGQQKMADLGTMHKADIMTSPHHGWTNGTFTNGYGIVPAFINAVHPEAVFTEDFSTHQGYIDTIKSPIQTWCQKNGVPHYRTQINGSMDIQIGREGWSALNDFKAYVTNESDWNWYDIERELMIDAQVKYTSRAFTTKYYSPTGPNLAGVIHYAVQAIVGSDDGTVTYDLRVRILDTGNADNFIEALLIGYKYTSVAPTINYIRKRGIDISAKNSQGTLALSGLTGDPMVVLEIYSIRTT